jgi:hypothetical protein
MTQRPPNKEGPTEGERGRLRVFLPTRCGLSDIFYQKSGKTGLAFYKMGMVVSVNTGTHYA